MTTPARTPDMVMADRPPSWYAQCQADDAAQVTGECAMSPSLHEQTMATAHEGAPTVAVQNRTHGAAAPDVDNGPPIGSVTG